MPNLIIVNVNNENMVGEMWRMTYEKKCFSSVVANRFIWLMRDGDAILLPYRPSEQFLHYALQLLEVDRSSLHILVPPQGEHETTLLTFDVLSSPEVIEHLKEVMHTSHTSEEWTVTPYYFDRASAWLIDRLGIPMVPGVLNYFRQGGAEQFNSKAEFRRFATAHAIPIPAGSVCSSVRELDMAVQEWIGVTGAVIVKQDLSSGCKGNVVVTLTSERFAPGAYETVLLDAPDETASVAQKLWSEMTGMRNVSLIVEVYHPYSKSYYTELEMPVNGRRPYLLNFGEQRMKTIWIGFEIPCSTLAPYQLSELLSLSMKLGDIAQSMGYTGKMSCDAICTQKGLIYFNEVNGRLGGCTHIHTLATRLLGRNYGNEYTLLTRNRVPAGSFSYVLEHLDNAGLLYTKKRGKGAVIISEDTERTHTIEYMVVASTALEANDLEKDVVAILERSIKDEDRHSCLGT